jgi:hypothetical protein
MFHPIWRLSEAGADNLGVACNEEGLFLGRTPLIERRGGRFVCAIRTTSSGCSAAPTGRKSTRGRS